MLTLFRKLLSKDINTDKEAIDTDIVVFETNKETNKDTDKDTSLLSEIQKVIIREVKKNNKITVLEISSIIDINLRNTKKILQNLRI